MIAVVTIIVLVGYLALAAAILFCHPVASVEVQTSILTTLQNAGFVVAVSYWLGSSSGSASKDASKDALLTKAVEKQGTGDGTVATKTAETAKATAQTAASTAAVAEATAKEK